MTGLPVDSSPPWSVLAAIMTPIAIALGYIGRKIIDALTATYLADKELARKEREQDKADKRKEDEQNRVDKREEHERYLLSLEARDVTQKLSMERLWANQDIVVAMMKTHEESAISRNAQLIAAIHSLQQSNKATGDSAASQMAGVERRLEENITLAEK